MEWKTNEFIPPKNTHIAYSKKSLDALCTSILFDSQHLFCKSGPVYFIWYAIYIILYHIIL